MGYKLKKMTPLAVGEKNRISKKGVGNDQNAQYISLCFFASSKFYLVNAVTGSSSKGNGPATLVFWMISLHQLSNLGGGWQWNDNL